MDKHNELTAWCFKESEAAACLIIDLRGTVEELREEIRAYKQAEIDRLSTQLAENHRKMGFRAG